LIDLRQQAVVQSTSVDHGDSRRAVLRPVYWLVCFVLVLPATIPYFAHYLVGARGLVPTGFIQYDMPYYTALAHGYFSDGHFHFTYGNPFSPSYSTPRIYFQPFTLILAVLSHWTNLSGGAIFMLVGLLAAVLCVMLALILYRDVVGLSDPIDWVGFTIFVWGGGLLVVAGIAYSTWTHRPGIFRFDPFGGWWNLNFGRNFVYPTEAFYHSLFIACIIFAVRERYSLSALFAFLVSISHPFTGLELLCILCAWCFLELVILRRKQVPVAFFLCCCALLVLHGAYYWVFLGRFPEHRSLVGQWTLSWLLRYWNYIPAYALVAFCAVWRVRNISLARRFFAVPRNRLLAVWFVTAFALAKHDVFMRSVQPLHFTRGYIWMPLYLMGAPVLVSLLKRLFRPPLRLDHVVCGLAIVSLFLLDNAVWFGSFLVRQDQGFRLTYDQKQLLSWMERPDDGRYLVVAQDPSIGYMAVVYTPLRAWRSHVFNTPQSLLRQQELDSFYLDHAFPPAWKGRPLLVVFDLTHGPAKEQWIVAAGGQKVFNNNSFDVFRILP
jgi:hypothetical protein